MKHLLLMIAIMATTLLSSAQTLLKPENVSLENNRISLHGIEKVDSASISMIHDGIVKWISLNYKDPQSVIKMDTPSTIVLEGFIPTSKFEHIANIAFDIKEGRYRWKIDNIIFYSELLAKYGGNLKTEVETQPWYENSIGDERINEIIKRYGDAAFVIIEGINKHIKDSDW